MKQLLSQYAKKLPIFIFAAFLSALSINSLLVPHQFIGGGLNGISTLLYYITGLPLWLFIVAGSIPLYIYSLKKASLSFSLTSMVCTVLQIFFLWLTDGWVIPVENPIVAALTAGVMGGFAAGLVLRQGSSLGGLGIVSFILNKKLSFPIGGIDMTMNLFILVALGLYTGSIEIGLLSLMAIYATNTVMDAVQEGFNRRKTVFIISDKWQEISDQLATVLRRGVTLLESQGWYTHTNRKVIYCIIRTMELSRLKSLVFDIDPNAFLSVIETREVMAKTFDNKAVFKDDV